MQNYLKLKDLTVEDGKRIFAYRTRMANYGENFRGLSDPKQCPLCSTHLDNQQMAFIWPRIKPNLCEAGKYEGIFKTYIPIERVKNLRIIARICKENYEEI